MSHETIQVVSLSGSALNSALGTNKEIDALKFDANTQWLHSTFVSYTGKHYKIIDSFDLAYRHSYETIEHNIEKARKEQQELGSLDPVPNEHVPNIDEPIGEQKLEIYEEDQLLDWYTRRCPKGYEKWYDVAKELKETISNSLAQDKGKNISYRIYQLRTIFFKQSILEGNITFWGQLIEAAKNHPKDMVKPHEIGNVVRDRMARNRLNLVFKDDPEGRYDQEMSFEDYLDTLNPKFADRVKWYREIRDWLIGYDNWRKERTRREVCAAIMRSKRDNPWGEQAYWEHVLRIRRILEGWKIFPPDFAIKNRYDGPLDEESVERVVQNLRDHPLKGRREMIRWYIELNKRVVQKYSQKNGPGKKRVTPEESKGNLPMLIEYGTFYTSWIHFRYGFTLLEAVEIAYFGRTHKIDPDLKVSDYASNFQSMLQSYLNTETEIRGFPNLDMQPDAVNMLLGNKNLSQAQAKTIGVHREIHERLDSIDKRNRFKEDCKRRQIAGLHTVTYEEWLHNPSGDQNSAKESWITGQKLMPGMYTAVYVENTNSKHYRRITKLRNDIKKKFQPGELQKTPEGAIEEEDEKEPTVKCSVCSKQGTREEMKKVHMHAEHMKAFWAYAARSRAKDKEQTKDEETAEAQKEGILKRKYANLTNTIMSWAELEDSKEIAQRIKKWAKRRKINKSEVSHDVSESEDE